MVDPIYVWWIPSEVVSEIAGRWRTKNHPRAGSHHMNDLHTSASPRGTRGIDKAWSANFAASQCAAATPSGSPGACTGHLRLWFISGSGVWYWVWSILGWCVVCGVWWIPSEVVFEIAGRWRIKNHPRAGLHQHDGFTTHQSSTPTFSWNGHEESSTNLHGPLDGGPAPRRENV